MRSERLPVALAALTGAALGFLLVLTNVGLRFDLRFLDLLNRTSTVEDPSPVLIIDIDTETINLLGWPISPEIFALVLHAAHIANAESIGIDLLFRDQRLAWVEGSLSRGLDSSKALLGEADDGDIMLGEMAVSTGAVLGTYRLTDVDERDLNRELPATPQSSRGSCSKPNKRSWLSPLRAGLSSVSVGHVHLEQSVDGVYRHINGCLPVHDGCARALTSVMLDPSSESAYCDGKEIVPYSRAFEDFPRLTMAHVLEMMGSEEGMARLRAAMQGRHVLVGPSDAGVGDLAATPMAPWEPLVTVHANRIEAKVLGRRIIDIPSHIPFASGMLVILLLCAIALPARVWLAVAGGMAILGVLVSYVAFRSLSVWFPVSPFVFPACLGAIAAAGAIGWKYLKFNQMLTQAFGNYVSPDVLDWLQKTRGEALDPAAAERREITVLFSDIAGYTSLSNSLAPDKVIASLRLYLKSMVGVVQRHGGYVDKINGDGLMVLFGAPKKLANGQQSALSCAMEMHKEVDALQDSWREITGGDLNIRIGIATGTVFVGNLGGAGHIEYTGIGQAVNLAARLESKSEKGGIMICETTSSAISALPEGEWVEVDLKGYESHGPVRVYSIIPFNS